jgi:pectate lyase
MVSIEGSRPTAIHALDYVAIEGTATLSFTLDERGVTPITIQNRVRGLRLAAHSRLKIALSAAPPHEDIRLVSSYAATQGVFEGLPEGSEIAAQFEGRTYRWQLTYRGGAGHDLVLKIAGAAAQLRPLPEPPVPLWLDHPLYPLTALTGTPAFPGAEGFGAFTPGGRGGKTLYVDNLNDAGPGSLRAAVETAGARTVRFRVGGAIELKSAIAIREPFLTIDGQDAPAGGITLRRHGMEVRTHDVVLRYFRIRIGDEDVKLDDRTVNYNGGDGEYALYFRLGSGNAIADHLSLSWSTNKTLSTTRMADRITIQYCILSESLNFAGHGYASITGGNRVTWHHNLFAHHFNRNVRFQGMVDADFRNNVIYDWGEGTAYGEFDRLNYVGNYLKPGPSTTQRPLLFHNGAEVVAPASLFVADNVIEGDASVNQDNWRGMGYYYFLRKSLEASKPFPAPAVTTEPAPAAYEHVLKDAGATLPGRDAVDERIVREVREGGGHIIKWVRDIQ